MPKFIRNLEQLCEFDNIKSMKTKSNEKKDLSKDKALKARRIKDAQLGINQNSLLICKELLNILHGMRSENTFLSS